MTTAAHAVHHRAAGLVDRLAGHGVRLFRGRERHPDRECLELEVGVWVTPRDAAVRTVDGHCTTDDARGKPDHLYPVFHD
jgi:hypothetical protein